MGNLSLVLSESQIKQQQQNAQYVKQYCSESV